MSVNHHRPCSFSTKPNLLAQLLDLKQQVAICFEKGELITAPGIPPNYLEPKKLVTKDCIRPAAQTASA